MALASPLVTADMVEASEFPHLANKYHVYGVPRTVISDVLHIEGAVPEKALVTKLMTVLDTETMQGLRAEWDAHTAQHLFINRLYSASEGRASPEAETPNMLLPLPPSPRWKNTPPPVERTQCQTPFVEPRPGQICAACGEGVLAFDGRMELSCPRCGQVAGGGGFT